MFMGIEHASWEKLILAPDEQTAYFSVEGPLTGHPNEDRLEVTLGHGLLRACIADGHWGDGASQQIVDFWASEDIPSDRGEAVRKVEQLEEELFRRYGKEEMDPNSEADWTPEAGFIAIAINDDDRSLSLTGYGDCRLLVVNDGVIRFELPTEQTWLGVFSRLGLRSRKPVKKALRFNNIPLLEGDYVALFSDGLDEPGHNGKASITSEEIATYFDKRPAIDTVRSLGNWAFSNNAQDDVSLLVHQVSLVA